MKKPILLRAKPLTALLGGLIALCLCCTPAFAHDTEIFAVVPQTHTVTVSMEAGGAVIEADGTVHTESFAVQVPHNGTLTLILRPDSGYALDAALLDGQAVKVTSGRLEIANVRQDGTLLVQWKESAAPPSEKTYTIVGTVTENGSPAQGVTLELRSELKTFVTGTDGKFRFDKVESGAHSLTALRDGKLVGYLQFHLDEGGTDVSLSRLPDGSFEVRMDSDTTILKLDVALGENGAMEITQAEPIADKQAEEPYPPVTGDQTALVCWLAAIPTAGAALLLMRRRHKNQRMQSLK